MNHAELLKKYMRLVYAEESITFLDRLDADGTSMMFRDDPFTADEIAELRKIEGSVWI